MNQRSKLTRQVPWVVVAVIALGGLVYAGYVSVTWPRGKPFLDLMRAVLESLPANEQEIGQAIVENYQDCLRTTVRWSGVYHGCLFLSAALGAFAGLVVKLEFVITNEQLKKDLAAFLAMSASLLITVSTVGSFQNHWQVNRLATARLESLGYDFATGDRKDLASFVKRLRDISMERNQEIVGGSEKSGQEGTSNLPAGGND